MQSSITSVASARYTRKLGSSSLPAPLISLPTPGGRKDGVVYVSTDGGKTWPVRRDIIPGYFAYSALIQLDDATVGLFYESNGYRDIRFIQLPVQELIDHKGEHDR